MRLATLLIAHTDLIVIGVVGVVYCIAGMVKRCRRKGISRVNCRADCRTKER